MSVAYVLASLPMLLPDRAPTISVDYFCTACCGALSAADAEAAALLARGSLAPSAHPAVKAWRNLEAAIDGAIGKKRLARRGATSGAQAPETTAAPVWLMRMIDAAFESAPDPMAREQLLLKVRWAAAEDFGGFDPMAKNQLFAYAVKLRLAVRQAAWDVSMGQERLEAALPQQML